MIGAIVGDVIGSVFERFNTKSMEFPLFSQFTRFTDDTVLTVAVADAIMSRDAQADHSHLYATKIKAYGRRYPNAGYGQMFRNWVASDSMEGYGSYGNGSAMRVSPVGFAFDSLDEVLKEAKLSAMVTHSHPQAVIGAQAVASAIFLARNGESKAAIKQFVSDKFGYNLNQTLDEIRPVYKFDVSCAGSVPQAIIAFLESEHFEDAIRKAISLGGDSDTIACIAGGIAQAHYKKIPSELVERVWSFLDAELQDVVSRFNERYNPTYYL
ncbi:ADP-ribosylglycohydrolase family protein [Anaerolineales bacterium HSG6]|nr:ADP-ribosylglycohydrolase family protein [Anaerolineales bacterium HSG6]